VGVGGSDVTRPPDAERPPVTLTLTLTLNKYQGPRVGGGYGYMLARRR